MVVKMPNESRNAPNTSDMTNDRVTSPVDESACHMMPTAMTHESKNGQILLINHLMFGVLKSVSWVSVGFVFGRIAMSCRTPTDNATTTWMVVAMIVIQSLLLSAIWIWKPNV